MKGFRRYTTRDATQFRDAWAPHTQIQRHGVLAMMTRPYKPRDVSYLILSYLIHGRKATLHARQRPRRVGTTLTHPESGSSYLSYLKRRGCFLREIRYDLGSLARRSRAKILSRFHPSRAHERDDSARRHASGRLAHAHGSSAAVDVAGGKHGPHPHASMWSSVRAAASPRRRATHARGGRPAGA